MSPRAKGESPVRPKLGGVSGSEAAIAGVEGMAAAPAAESGEDESCEEFQRTLKEAADVRRAKGNAEERGERREDLE